MTGTQAKLPEDITEAAAIAMYGRGYGHITDPQAEAAARVAWAVVSSLDTISDGLTRLVVSHMKRPHTSTE